MTTQPEPTTEQRRIIYQARRGLKELDFYIDPYVKELYLAADTAEQATFAELLTYEDPDLLDYFTNQSQPDDAAVWELVNKIKTWRHSKDLT
ncbi:MULTISPECIES: succinate dehydrogenase assembly factor 2 [Psychrobacter]|jgi:antitoxin CptB|uniref:FAD assembly factor SdhE n=1 Tax=Psychrobacter TaxID=497 RepID=UPI000ED07F5C|nr:MULTISPECIES: succinate dehydrogenase assembly factor 2 [Psychrobacter]MCG3882730.1 succinate dehydrogenase assembly factor 2 [Psychrobacter sp. Ps3]HAM60467.1 succinate dehydrogenase assembly factor 2 [Psychrobacter sp.]|tara:strand:+ start:703 stop:978 length:276 start_codon:yes stop_codon:yes gene_type:complete